MYLLGIQNFALIANRYLLALCKSGFIYLTLSLLFSILFLNHWCKLAFNGFSYAVSVYFMISTVAKIAVTSATVIELVVFSISSRSQVFD